MRKSWRALPQRAALSLLLTVLAAGLTADWWAAPYDEQFREFSSTPPSRKFPLGTDDLGRDRLARLAVGSRVSLLLALAAAAVSVAAAAVVGGVAGYRGGLADRLMTGATDVLLSVPSVFILLLARGALPLEVSPGTSVALTFALLGALSWAGPARVIRAGVRAGLRADWARQARALGLRRRRVLWVHVLPQVAPLLGAQFLVTVPALILAEANLGFLGLGVTEPLPSWGGLLRELQGGTTALDNPALLAPAALLVLVVMCLRSLLPSAKELP